MEQAAQATLYDGPIVNSATRLRHRRATGRWHGAIIASGDDQSSLLDVLTN